MNNTDRHFRGQLKNEEVLRFFRHHWITILPKLLAIFFLAVILAVSIPNLPALFNSEVIRDNSALTFAVISALLFIVFFIHRQFMAIFQYFLNTIIITNYRIVDIDRSIFFRDSKDSVDLAKIQDIQKTQNGILENILNFGTFTIVLSGTHAAMQIDMVPNPEYYFKVINRAKRDYIHKRRRLKAYGVDEEQEVIQNLSFQNPLTLPRDN